MPSWGSRAQLAGRPPDASGGSRQPGLRYQQRRDRRGREPDHVECRHGRTCIQGEHPGGRPTSASSRAGSPVTAEDQRRRRGGRVWDAVQRDHGGLRDLDDREHRHAPNARGSNAVAGDINNLGMIVGSSETSVAGKTHAFLITPGGGMTDLGGLPNGDGTSFGLAVNDLGRVVGYGGAAGSNFAFRSLADGTLVNLNTLPGTTSSVAYGINNLNQVVGSASDAAGFSRAFLYTDAAGLVDLNSLIDRSSGWVLTSAHGINDSGQIVGNGLFQGQARAFVLTPSGVIPEPTSFLLLGLGLSALGIVWARRGSADQSLAPSQD
ncbi:MAG: PEP-CTERM sorting domain-containing protein [Isosphaeraceae bacterium]